MNPAAKTLAHDLQKLYREPTRWACTLAPKPSHSSRRVRSWRGTATRVVDLKPYQLVRLDLANLPELRRTAPKTHLLREGQKLTFGVSRYLIYQNGAPLEVTARPQQA